MTDSSIHRRTPVPLYYQLAEIIRRDVTTRVLQPGDQLPTEVQMMAKYRLSRTTVRQALNALITEGLVTILRGKGTFVSEPKMEQELTGLTGFVEDMLMLGKDPAAKVLGFEETASDGRVAEKLKLPQGEPVTRIARVRLADRKPVSLDITFLPADIGRRVVQDDLATIPIFTLLEDKYGIRLSEAEYVLEAVAADAFVAKALAVKQGSPILLIERTSYAEPDARPVDYEKLYYRGDVIRYSMHLKRSKPPSMRPIFQPTIGEPGGAKPAGKPRKERP